MENQSFETHSLAQLKEELNQDSSKELHTPSQETINEMGAPDSLDDILNNSGYVNSEADSSYVPPVSPNNNDVFVSTKETNEDVNASNTAAVLKTAENARDADEKIKKALVEPEEYNEAYSFNDKDTDAEKRETLFNVLNNPVAAVRQNKTLNFGKTFNKEDINVESKASAMDITNNLSFLTKLKPTIVYPIIAAKSGYRAFMSPLTTNGKLAIRGIFMSAISDSDRFARIVNFIHRQIESCGYTDKLSLEKFCRDTAEDDIETFLFGIYGATFPEATEYSFQCPHCGKAMKLKVTPNNLIQALDMEKTGEYVTDLLENIEMGPEFQKRSMVNQEEKFVCEETGIIAYLRIPSIEKSMETTKITKKLSGLYESALISNVRFIDRLEVPDYNALNQGINRLMNVTDVHDILNYLDKGLTNNDSNDLMDAIVDYDNRYKINYRIGKVICPDNACRREIPHVDIDIAQLLFLASIGGKLQG